MKQQIFGYSYGSKIELQLFKEKYFRLFLNGVLIARFDTEEKARLYIDGFIKGVERA